MQHLSLLLRGCGKIAIRLQAAARVHDIFSTKNQCVQMTAGDSQA
jgi:hypothetical protein